MTEQTDRLIAEIEKERTSERASIDFLIAPKKKTC
jgi:hypothetical protein